MEVEVCAQLATGGPVTSYPCSATRQKWVSGDTKVRELNLARISHQLLPGLRVPWVLDRITFDRSNNERGPGIIDIYYMPGAYSLYIRVDPVVAGRSYEGPANYSSLPSPLLNDYWGLRKLQTQSVSSDQVSEAF
ncbi:hypothetical protein WAI453_011017 [Rhynchosporium graminicola]